MYQFILRFLLFSTVHSILAVPGIKNRIIGILGRFGRWYRLGYNMLSLLLFSWVMLAWPHPPVLYFVPGVWGPLCYLLQICIAALLFRCAAQLDLREFLGFGRKATGNEPTKLIQTGCYGWVRHPQYTLAIAFLALNPVMTGRWLALTMLSTAYFVIGAWLEEKRLLTELGDEYRQYREGVPMFLPTRRSKRRNVTQ